MQPGLASCRDLIWRIVWLKLLRHERFFLNFLTITKSRLQRIDFSQIDCPALARTVTYHEDIFDFCKNDLNFIFPIKYYLYMLFPWHSASETNLALIYDDTITEKKNGFKFFLKILIFFYFIFTGLQKWWLMFSWPFL